MRTETEFRLRLPEITDAAIDQIVQAFRIQCDAERRAVLAHRDTVDVRACAGSGKTTLLVAKLALLLSGWHHRYRGICILSHTNVAHEEIRRRFSAMPHLRALESYPHFLGTIQSFVNTSLGVPGAIERLRVRPSVIDDEIFGRKAFSLIRGHWAAVKWLQNQRNGDALVTGLRLHIDGAGTLSVNSAGGDLPSPDTVTGKALIEVKNTLTKDGVFRYEDMDVLGLWYVNEHPEVRSAITTRFPVVMMDETQDTEARQASLLDHVFKDRSIVQRFGDDRQAIFRGESEEQETGFPRPGYLSIRSSLRLSPSIARLVENVCIGNVETLMGRPDRLDHAHTVFLFNPTRVAEVMPAFARLVGAELGAGLSPQRVVAVGFRRQGEVDPAKIPCLIGDYWPAGTTARRTLTASFDSLREYIGAAVADLNHRNGTFDASVRLLQAACRMLDLQGLKDVDRPFTPNRLTRRLADIDIPERGRLSVLIGTLLLGVASGERLDTDAFADGLCQGLAPIYQGTWCADVQAFCNIGPPADGADGDNADTPADGTFRLRTDQGLIEVGLSTIHGVKGETLDATLVLCTYYFTHDLKQLVDAGLLCGKRPSAAKAAQVRLRSNVKRIYVAMTRPTRLLCLALREDHVSVEQKAEMERMGWRFQQV